MKSQGRGSSTRGSAGGERGRKRRTPAQANAVVPLHARFAPVARHGRSDDANAFIPDPDGGPARFRDDLAENLAEEYLESATRGNEVYEDALDQVVPEEIGGPFIETSAAEEFAHDTDEANPEDAHREPLPRAGAGLVDLADDEEPDHDHER
jgi:hypothetical protein